MNRVASDGEVDRADAPLEPRSALDGSVRLRWAQVLRAEYAMRGASDGEVDLMLQDWPVSCANKYENAWNNFWPMLAPLCGCMEGVSTEAMTTHASQVLAGMLLWRLASYVKTFARTCGLHQARNLYSALVSHPACQQLRFESTLLRTKRQWNASAPRYGRFYELHPIWLRLQSVPSPITEGEVRLRVIVLPRLLCLCEDVICLHRARRNIDRSAQPWKLPSRSKR